MSKIFIIDDDIQLNLLAENLMYRGHDTSRISTATEALDQIDDLLQCDLIILDIIMELPASHTRRMITGITNTGMLIYRELRSRNIEIPILAYSACQDSDTIDVFKDDKHSKFVSKYSSPSLHDIVESINDMLGIPNELPSPVSFVVHGHNDAVKYELKNYLQNTLGFTEPIILHEQPNIGRTIIEKFEDYALKSNIVFVLLTPDDKVVNDGDDNEKRRARQNVIFELGFFLGMLGRKSGRVFLLYSGPLELPSDLSGVIYIDISEGVLSAGEQLRKELSSVI